MMDRRYFSRATFAFLRELAQNNEKDWFEANKQRYLADVRNPVLRRETRPYGTLSDCGFVRHAYEIQYAR